MPVTPSQLPQPLADNPNRAPLYAQVVKTKNNEEVNCGDPNITRGLLALMNLHAVIGGAACHWGGPAALAEIMSAVHGHMFHYSEKWHEDFNFINDAGHTENGVYALRANLGFDNLSFEDLKGFRSIESKLTGHGESHLNPEGVLFSNGPLGSSIAQAQGIAMGDKLANRKRLTFCVASDGASMEGEAKEAFAAIPGLAKKGKMNPFVLIISDNNTKLSGRINEQSFDMAPSFEAMERLGWKTQKVNNGHDLQEVFTAVETAVEHAQENPEQPVFLWVKTTKGKGVASTEESSSGGHGYPLKMNDGKIVEFLDEIFSGQTPKELATWAQELMKVEKPKRLNREPKTFKDLNKEKVQAGFARALSKAAKEGLPVFSLSSDLQGSTGVAAFHKEFPDRWLDLGIAESNMVSAGAGISKAGLIPIVDTFAQFGVTKGNLPLTMAALSQAPVIACFSHTGYQDAADGASHQATTYLAAVNSIPHTTVIVCSSSKEAEEYLYQAIHRYHQAQISGKDHQSYIFFVGRENFAENNGDVLDYHWERAQILNQEEEADVVIVACGPMVTKALRAKDKLQEMGISPIIVNNPFVNRVDIETITHALNKANGKVITIEDHQTKGGMGSLLAHALSQNGVSFRMKSLGIEERFGQSAYLANDLYDASGLNSKGIIEAFKSLHD